MRPRVRTEKEERGNRIHPQKCDAMHTKSPLAVYIYTLPVVYISILPPSCNGGGTCAQQHHFLEEERILSCPFTYLCFF